MIWVLAGNRWFIQTTEESLSEGLVAKIWAGLRKEQGMGRTPGAGNTGELLAPLGLEEDEEKAVVGSRETKLCFRRGTETGHREH